MENIRNLELARLHKDIETILASLKRIPCSLNLFVIPAKIMQETIDKLDTIETRLHNLAYGDCQFVHRLPYPVKSSVKHKPLTVFPEKDAA